MFWSTDRAQAGRIERKLDALGVLLTATGRDVLTQGGQIMATLDEFRAQLAAEADQIAQLTSVEDSALAAITAVETLVQALKDQIAGTPGIPQDIVDSVTNATAAIGLQKDRLAASVATIPTA